MKNTYKIITIGDIVEWDNKNEIKLNPKYQRNTVWNDKTKSYLMDTIIRGLAIPPIFLRQSIDVVARVTFREVLDGQQRLRAILDFINNKYVISKSHNKDFGGIYYDELSYEVKEDILSYEIFAVIISEKDDNIVYDMFARLNTNNYVLNKQEIRNSKYWGEFKVAAYQFAAENRKFFSDNHIFNDKNFSRMDDVEFVSVLMNLIINGIVTDTPTSLDKLYEENNKSFEKSEFVSERINQMFKFLNELYPLLNSNNYFSSKVSVYTLFAVILQLKYENMSDNNEVDTFNFDWFINKINDFNNELYDCIKLKNIDNKYYFTLVEFDRLHRTRTTNKEERIKRCSILREYICEDKNA